MYQPLSSYMFNISNDQYNELGEIQRKKFCAKEAQFLRTHLSKEKIEQLNEPLEDYIDEICLSALQIGLVTEKEISKFILLNIAIGKNFYELKDYCVFKSNLISGKFSNERLLDNEYHKFKNNQ